MHYFTPYSVAVIEKLKYGSLIYSCNVYNVYLHKIF